jgi:aspartate racemase
MRPKYEKIIGIVGGLGPYTGIDLVKKIFDNTLSSNDQGHLSIALLSVPKRISDRTSYLLKKTSVNPAYAIANVILNLEQIGASVIGIPCVTAHAPQIYNTILDELNKANSKVKILNLINEVNKFVKVTYPKIETTGVLCTTGSYQTRIHMEFKNKNCFKIITPSKILRNELHQAIYDSNYGIKAYSNPPKSESYEIVCRNIEHLRNKGADAVILGCTELPLAINIKGINNTLIIDPTLILARALIRQVDPRKLRPFKRYFDR